MGPWVHVAGKRIGLAAAVIAAGGLVLALALAAWPAPSPPAAARRAPAAPVAPAVQPVAAAELAQCLALNARLDEALRVRDEYRKAALAKLRFEMQLELSAERHDELVELLARRGSRRVTGAARRKLRREEKALRAELHAVATRGVCGNDRALNRYPYDREELEALRVQVKDCLTHVYR